MRLLTTTSGTARITLAAFAVLLLAVSCESVFTTSPLAFLQRDPANLSPAEQVTYGEDALASGDPEKMGEAYAALKDTDDPDTQLLAADLALGAAELEASVAEAVADLSAGGDPETVLEETLSGFSQDDLERLAGAADLIDAADDSVQPTAEQYAFAAVGLIAVAADEAGDVNSLDSLSAGDPGYDQVQQAQSFLVAAQDSLQESGDSTDLLDQIGGAVGL
jgi:hypothetical protein